ncbi:PREDICTED: serine/arginine repetitive matrix protein 1-like isoform X2 [Branchiostoma belcheri]|uniref:Serine/arginine repetitive matrix protein 1-like isoform X2 n=1 Tax=Branchiostoma belcheri TaxID=7741 RepID=A0A6P4ZZB6_BRABE|nr:PREDICTED: serine/arginine repetitive matrix protein 1-like isoform X2 [Branchiostoma belcheri]
MPLKYLRKRGLVLKKWTFRHFGRLKRKKRSSSPSSNESSPSQRRKQEDDQGTVAADDEFDFPNIEAHKLDTSVARGKAELSKRRSTKPRRKPTRQRSTSGNEDSNDFGFSIAPETKADNRQPAIANELNGSVDSLDREDVFNQNTVGAAVSPNRQPYAASASAERLPSPDWVTVSFTQGQEPQMSPTKPAGVSLTEPSPKASPNRSPRSSPIPAKGVSTEDQAQSSPAWTKINHSSSQESKGSLVKRQQSMPEPADDPVSPEWTTITHRHSVQERQTISSRVRGFALPGLASGGSSRSSSNKPSPASPEHFLQSPTAGSPQARPAASPTKTGVLIPGLEELESSPVKLKHTPTKEKLPSPPEEATVPSWAKDTQLKKVRTPEEMPPPEEPEEREGPWTKQAQLKKVESPPSKEDDEEMAKENEPPEQDWRARLKKSFKSGKDTKKEKTQEKAAPDWAKKAEEKTKRMQTMVETSAEREKASERAAPDWARQAEEKTKRVQTITELSKEKEVEKAAPDWAKQAEEKTKRVLDIAESSKDKQQDQTAPEWANRAKNMTARVKSNKVLVELETKKENTNTEANLPPLKQLARTPESNGELDTRNGDKAGSWFSETKLKKTRPGSGSGANATESSKSPSWIEQSRKKSQRCNALIETADPEKRLERKLSGSADEEPKAPFVREVSLRSRKNSDKSGGDSSPSELAQIPDWKVQLQKRKKELGAAADRQSWTTIEHPHLESLIEKQSRVSKSAENLLDNDREFVDLPHSSRIKPPESVEGEKTDSFAKEKVSRVKSCPVHDSEKNVNPVKKLFKQFSSYFSKAPEVRGDTGTKSHLEELKGRDSQVSSPPAEEPGWKQEIRRRRSQGQQGYTDPSELSDNSPITSVQMPPKSKEAEEPPPEPAWKRELSRRRREGRYQTQIITSDSKDSPDSPANWLQKLRSRPQSAAPTDSDESPDPDSPIHRPRSRPRPAGVDLTSNMQAEPVWKQEAERKRNRFQTALAENLS